LSDIERKLQAVESRFRKDSKQYDAARYIVRQNRKIPTDERKAICQEIPIAEKSLQGLFTELRKMGLYPPQETSESPSYSAASEVSPETSLHVPEAPQPPLQEYATKEDFETLRDSINYLASIMSGVDPESLGEEEEEEKEVEDIQPEKVELIQPEEIIIEETSLIRQTVFLKPKTLEYFDLVLQGGKVNDEVTLDLGPLNNFKGNISDFFDVTANLCFNIILNLNIGVLPYVRDVVVS